jgi:phosphate uptake regulator
VGGEVPGRGRAGPIVEDLPWATAALLSGDDEVVPELVKHQQVIDAWYPQVEAMASREILRQAPAAPDLRFLLSVPRVAREFERAHCSLVLPGPVIMSALICRRAAAY